MRGDLKPFKRAQPAFSQTKVIEMLQISESRIDILCDSIEDYQTDYTKPKVGYMLDSFEEEAEA